jgi:hypothetical protein
MGERPPRMDVHAWDARRRRARCGIAESSYSWSSEPSTVTCAACRRALAGDAAPAASGTTRTEGVDVLDGSQGQDAARLLLAADPMPGCLLDPGGIIRFVNAAWDRFAEENGGAPRALGAAVVGTSWLDHVQGDEVRQHCRALLERALQGSGWAGVVELCECNSPELARLVACRFERVAGPDGGEPVGLAATYTTLHTRLLDRTRDAFEGDDGRFRGADGSFLACACCRRVLGPRPPGAWTFVPRLVRSPPPDLVYTICGACRTLYQGGAAPGLPGRDG